MQPLRFTLLASLLIAGSTVVAEEPSPPDEAADGRPRNVILLIGDGMDEHQITIARNYLAGAEGELLLDKMPMRGAVQVLTKEDKVDGSPIYVADSANTATSLATGVVTSRGRIATSAGSDLPLPTIVELASEAGLRTGLVTTASVTDATAAAFAAHINLRFCENPDAMVDITYRNIPLGDCSEHLKRNGGGGSIAEQLAGSSVDIILGGGSKHFEPLAEGMQIPVTALAREAGFEILTNKRELAAATERATRAAHTATGGADKRILGLFSASTMPVRLQGENGRSAEDPDPSLLNHIHPYLGDVTLPDPMVCEPNPGFDAVPSLKAMTELALGHLSRQNTRGFFLMIESASIDKQSHERKPCGSIGEMEQLNEALAAALYFAEHHPRTLILVTADHSQAAQLIPYHSLFEAYPIPTYTPGKLVRIVTPEGATMAVNYATTNFQLEEHTGAAVPLYGNQAAIGVVPSFLRQPELFQVMRDYLGL